MTTIVVRSVDPEVQRAAILSNPIFLQAINATPAQIDAFLLSSVTTIAQARPILSILLQMAAYQFNQQIVSSGQ